MPMRGLRRPRSVKSASSPESVDPKGYALLATLHRELIEGLYTRKSGRTLVER